MKETKLYDRKYICSGSIIEQYQYEVPIYKGFKSNNSKGKNRNGVHKEKNRAQSMGRARQKVIRSINSNPDLNKFLTLTFEENVTDLNYSHNEFKKWIDRVNYNVFKTKKRILKYVAVIEFQKRGAVHYHIICNLPYIDIKSLSDIWGHGFIWINKIRGYNDDLECDNVGAYVTKYMVKDNSDERLINRKSYLMSRNLNKPQEILVGVKEKDLLEQVYHLKEPMIAYMQKSSHLTSAYYNEHTGIVIYNQYNLKRAKNQSQKIEGAVCNG